MSKIEELEKRIEFLEEELYETKMVAYGMKENLKKSSYITNYTPNLINPSTLNSKLNWLLLNYWNLHPARYYLSDKYLLKYYISVMIGDKYNVPILAVYDRAEDIDFNELPEKFVLKRTLGGGANEVMIVTKAQADLDEIRKKAHNWMLNTYNGRSRLIAEEYLDFEGDYIFDYKLYVFNGKAKLWMVGVMRKDQSTHRQYVFYDMDWKRYNLKVSRGAMDIARPDKWDEMVELGEKIGRNYPFIRVDMYEVNGRVYIGELTALPFNGLGPYEDYDRVFGRMLKLPTKQEIQQNYEEVYRSFPELLINPIYLKGKNGSYRIIQPKSSSDELPLPPKYFIQPK